MNKTTKNSTKSTKKNEPYSTLEGLESLCRRAMVYHQTGEYLPPDPLANMCKNKYKKKAGPSRKIPNENKNKSTTFGKGRVGVSCESFGVKHCACCNPHIRQNILTNTMANDNNDIVSHMNHLNNPIIIDSPKIAISQKNDLNQSNDLIIIDDLSPQNSFKTEIIDLDNSVVNNSTKDVKINYDHVYNSTIIDLSADESFGMLNDCNAIEKSFLIQSCDDIPIITQRNSNVHLENDGVNLENGGASLENDSIIIENAITSANVPLETPSIGADLLAKKEQLQKEIDECDRNIKTIFTKKLINLSPKSLVNANATVDRKLSRRELLQKEIDDCDRNFQNIFKKKSIINLTLTAGKSIPKNSNSIQTQIENILTTCNKARAPLQEIPKSSPSNSSPVATNCKQIGDCPICLESLGTKDLMSTVCGHIFCTECIKNVIKTSRACPTCRYPLTLKRIHPIFL